MSTLAERLETRAKSERQNAFGVYRKLVARDGDLTNKEEAELVDAMRLLGRSTRDLSEDRDTFAKLDTLSEEVGSADLRTLVEERKVLKGEILALRVKHDQIREKLASEMSELEQRDNTLGASITTKSRFAVTLNDLRRTVADRFGVML